MKAKGFYGLGVSILFVILGYWLYFEKSEQPGVNSTLVEIVGLATMIFFWFPHCSETEKNYFEFFRKMK